MKNNQGLTRLFFLRLFEVLDSHTEQDKTLAKQILDLLILKNRFKDLVGTGPI